MGQHHSGGSHGSVKEYVTGLILSLVLTFIPFGLIVFGSLSTGSIMAIIIVCAIAQLLVQGIFFLHMGTKTASQIWDSGSGLYIVAMILFFIIGTIWIFNHLSHNMLMGH